MKKIPLLLLLGSLLTFGLIGCEKEEELLEITAETEIDMSNLDLYLFRDDVQYVDLRNFEQPFSNGYIVGFQNIPFFDFLDFRAFDRDKGYDFNADQLLDTSILFNLFDPDKAILLYADGCIRSGYLKDVLNYLGYERVFVIGGYYEYTGENVISGTGKFIYGDSFYNEYLDESTGDIYMMYGTYGIARDITYIRLDIIDSNGTSYRNTGYDEVIDYNEMFSIIEEHIDESIYHFNELFEALENPESDITNLEDVDWDLLDNFITLFEKEYID